MSYQEDAVSFAVFENEVYPFLALCEEAGEVAGVFAKHIRKGGTVESLNRRQRELLEDELGDVLWNVVNCLSLLGITQERCQHRNIAKLANRKIANDITAVIRGTLDGE